MTTPSPKTAANGMALSLGVILMLGALAGLGGFFLVNHAMKVAAEQSKQDNEAAKKTISEAYSGTKQSVSLPPVITNMATPDSWVRMEAALVFDGADGKLPQTLPSEITEDILAYMRTLTLGHVSGPSGFIHLKEDIVDRAYQRSEGRVGDVLILTLVFE